MKRVEDFTDEAELTGELRRAVDYVAALGIYKGRGDGSFDKNAPLSRGAHALTLYRAAGSPSPDEYLPGSEPTPEPDPEPEPEPEPEPPIPEPEPAPSGLVYSRPPIRLRGYGHLSSVLVGIPDATHNGHPLPHPIDWLDKPMVSRVDTNRHRDQWPTAPDGRMIVSDVIIDGRNEIASIGSAYDNGRDYIAERCLFINGKDGAKWERDVTLRDCVSLGIGTLGRPLADKDEFLELTDGLTDFTAFAPKSGDHADGVQCSGNGRDLLAERCLFFARFWNSTNAVRIATNRGPVTRTWVKHSLVFGGSTTVHFDRLAGGPITDSGLDGVVVLAGSNSPYREGRAYDPDTAEGFALGMEGESVNRDGLFVEPNEWRVDA